MRFLDERNWIGALRAIAVLVCVCVAGCAPFPGRINAEDLQPQKTVAVVSLLGDTFHGIRLRWMSTEAYKVSVPDWKVGARTEQFVKVFLERDGRRKAVVLEADRGLLKPIEDRRGPFGSDFSDLVAMAKAKNAEAVLVVFPFTDGLRRALGSGYGFLEGLMYVSAMFSVYSTETGRQLGWERSLPQTSRTDFPWRRGFDKYSASEMDTIRDLTIQNLQQTVNRALADLGY